MLSSLTRKVLTDFSRVCGPARSNQELMTAGVSNLGVTATGKGAH
jgi:hypothetical protein